MSDVHFLEIYGSDIDEDQLLGMIFEITLELLEDDIIVQEITPTDDTQKLFPNSDWVKLNGVVGANMNERIDALLKKVEDEGGYLPEWLEDWEEKHELPPMDVLLEMI